MCEFFMGVWILMRPLATIHTLGLILLTHTMQCIKTCAIYVRFFNDRNRHTHYLIHIWLVSYHSILLLNAHIMVKTRTKEANLEVQLLRLWPPQLLGSPLARVPAVKRFEKPICSFSLGCWESSACTLTRDQLCCFFYTGWGSDYSFCCSMKGFIALGKQWILGTVVEEFCPSSSAFLGRETLGFKTSVHNKQWIYFLCRCICLFYIIMHML